MTIEELRAQERLRTVAREMTAREIRLDTECSYSPEPSVIYADMDADGKFIAVTIVSRSE